MFFRLSFFLSFCFVDMLQDIFSLVAGVMLAVNRRAQVCRCLREVVALVRLLKKHSATFTSPSSLSLSSSSSSLSSTSLSPPPTTTTTTSSSTSSLSSSSSAAVEVSGRFHRLSNALNPLSRRGNQSGKDQQGHRRKGDEDDEGESSSSLQDLYHQAVIGIRMRASSCAEELVSQRYSMTSLHKERFSSSSSSSFSSSSSSSSLVFYDPRYLVFEFAYNLLLRDSQVKLIETFNRHVKRGQSLCHQMIMGAGKTTVVSPLLSLLLADGNRLIVQIVPQALLQFTRSVLRERFSAVIRKGVYTLHFSRYDSATPDLYMKILQAKDSRSIILMTPTTLKSLFLKSIQLLHALDISCRANEYMSELARLSEVEKAVQAGRSQLQKLQNNLGKLLGFQKNGKGRWGGGGDYMSKDR